MRSLLLATALLALPALAVAQGSLTPPGAPAPTMKTLEQLEPRTPLQAGAPGVTVNANGGFTITAPGSYYLTKDITVASGNGIDIEASHATLDLRGFSIGSTEPTLLGMGIRIPDGVTGVALRHGCIRSNTTTGFAYGIWCGDATSVAAEEIAVSGLSDYGMKDLALIRACTAVACGDTGLQALEVLDSTATDCGYVGISGVNVSNCHATSIQGDAISATNVTNCYGYSANIGSGIAAQNASNCQGKSRAGAGIAASNAVNCVGTSKAGIGLGSTTASNCEGRSDSNNGLVVNDRASHCRGLTSTGQYGLFVGIAGSNIGTANDCYGAAWNSGVGIRADTATNCHGRAVGAFFGLEAQTAIGCSGESVDNTAVQVTSNAENCRGIASGKGIGLFAGQSALNCHGESATNTGLKATIATNCTGTTQSGTYGLWVEATANICRGRSTKSTGAIALHAETAIGCSSGGGAIDVLPAKKFLGTP